MVNSLVDIHNAKTGKFSDKWESYLVHYDKLFTPFRDKQFGDKMFGAAPVGLLGAGGLGSEE